MSNTSLLGSYGGLGSSGLTFRNILINGEVTRINQRGFGGNWAALSVGEYGYDRWKKAGTDTMSQVVEEGNFIPGAQYTLSGTNVTTQTLTAPSSGHWTITVQQTARFVMLEAGPVATPFEHRPIGLELSLCQRYCYVPRMPANASRIGFGAATSTATTTGVINLPVIMRVAPTLDILNLGNFQLSDGSTSYPITSLSNFAITSSPGMVGYSANVAAGLTQFRYYYLERAAGTEPVISISAEL